MVFARLGPPVMWNQIQFRLRDEDASLAEQSQQQSANTRALILLNELLTKEQREDFSKTRSFVVIGSEGHSFRISGKTNVGNVTYFDDKGDIADYCATPVLYDRRGKCLPIYDVLIGQMLALKTDERYFIRTANVMNLYRERKDMLSF